MHPQSTPPIEWSVGIITNGDNNEMLLKSLASIKAAREGHAEIIVLGGNREALGEFTSHVKHIEYNQEKRLRFPTKMMARKFWRRPRLSTLFVESGNISRKKNLIAKSASGSKLLLLHDYICVNEDFFSSFQDVGDFDICVPQILNSDGGRFRDWTAWDHPAFNGEVGALLPYDMETPFYYISGTVIIVDRDFFLENPLNEDLFWGYAEDVEWSLRVRDRAKLRKNFKAILRSQKDKGNPLSDPGWARRTKLLEECMKSASVGEHSG
ncbi:hypothetical protein [Aestuariivita boseongensis]|uniref:hypothetical protein n=1 Tax=Aestuariivita boseongensis TaxID=1470562 RepID=UPI00067FB419|nr:hypothetical protein [Aestuariivita boseongensis]